METHINRAHSLLSISFSFMFRQPRRLAVGTQHRQLQSHRTSFNRREQSGAGVWAMGACGVLADIATVAQLSGLHAIMLIALAARLLRIPQCKVECAKLEECARKLRAPLQWPTTGQEIATQHPALAGLVVVALLETAGLVDSYRRSTLWCRVRTGRSTETRLREMQSRVNYLRALMLCVHANLLTQRPAVRPPSDTSSTP